MENYIGNVAIQAQQFSPPGRIGVKSMAIILRDLFIEFIPFRCKLKLLFEIPKDNSIG